MLKKKEIIGESFIPENYFSLLIPRLGKRWAESYVDRMNIVYLLPSEFVPSQAEILLFQNKVIIMNVNEEIAVEINNKQMLLLYKALFEYLKTSARKVSPRQFLKDSL